MSSLFVLDSAEDAPGMVEELWMAHQQRNDGMYLIAFAQSPFHRHAQFEFEGSKLFLTGFDRAAQLEYARKNLSDSD